MAVLFILRKNKRQTILESCFYHSLGLTICNLNYARLSNSQFRGGYTQSSMPAYTMHLTLRINHVIFQLAPFSHIVNDKVCIVATYSIYLTTIYNENRHQVTMARRWR